MANRKMLLGTDAIINLILGVALLVFPSSLVSYLGVPDAQSAFYPNILGGVLVGIAIALFIEARNTAGNTRGLGLLGAVTINLCGGIVLAAWLVWGGLELPLRGRVFLWSLVVILVGISCVELANKRHAHRHDP